MLKKIVIYLFPTKTDLQLILDSICQSFFLIPLLFKKTFFYALGLVVLQYLYFIFLIPPHFPDLQLSIILLCWYFIQFFFFIVLIPLHLYNRNAPQASPPKQLIDLNSFVKRIIVPFIIEPIKAFFIMVLYMLPGFILTILLIITLKLDISPPLSFTISAIGTIGILPGLIKACQYLFLPFVIFFNQKYLYEKKSSLKLCTHVAQGLIVILLILNLIFSLLLPTPENFIAFFRMFSLHISVPIFSIVSILFNYISIIFFTLLYFEKDRENII